MAGRRVGIAPLDNFNAQLPHLKDARQQGGLIRLSIKQNRGVTSKDVAFLTKSVQGLPDKKPKVNAMNHLVIGVHILPNENENESMV
jgi:hypothetical protein